MRRFGRWMFNGLAVLSLLLCVATIALWVRSYRIQDQLTRRSGPGNVQFAADCGYLGVISLGYDPQNSGAGPPKWSYDAEPAERFDLQTLRQSGAWRFAGVTYLHVSPGIVPPSWFLFVPMWELCLALAALPLGCLASIIYRRVKARRSAECCAGCGYNLTGNVSGVCPECGKPITVKRHSTAATHPS